MSDWIVGFITDHGYLGIFLMMLAENVFPPIPSELIMPFAGFAAARGDLDLWGVLIAGLLGSLAGTLPWYVAARALGLARLKKLADRFGRLATLNSADIDTANAWFSRYGRWAVLFGRLIPAIRTLISVPAGLVAMPFALFMLASAIGTLAWTAVLTGLGYLLADNYERVESFVDPVTRLVVVALVLVYLYRFFTWKRPA
jgi:membrane protein DedA with SNARE-associated domain